VGPAWDLLGFTVFTEVAVSPDGSHVAVVAMSDDFEENRVDIAVWHLDLDSPGRKTAALRLSYSPGSSRPKSRVGPPKLNRSPFFPLPT
jgi:hypothetical protein